MRLWHVGETGTSIVLPPAATRIEEPTYLPETPGGSRLVLSEDGTRLLYSDTSSRDEIFLIDVTAATTPVAVTSDTNFQPYIGTIILPVFAAVSYGFAATAQSGNLDFSINGQPVSMPLTTPVLIDGQQVTRVLLNLVQNAIRHTPADGSVTLYVGPKAPAGLETNWIPTRGKRPMPMLRFYGATDAIYDKTFKMPDFEEVQ
jgi:hypothetical protein